MMHCFGKMKEMKKNECSYGSFKLMKLAFVAFVLFLLRVWPALNTLVNQVHWVWFLGASALFCLLAMKHMWMHGMKKKRGKR